MKRIIDPVYVLGFLFDVQHPNLVMLIKKDKGPPWLIGRLNGIGGKMEPRETPLQAMEREAQEEVNPDLNAMIGPWAQFAIILDGDGHTVYCFVAYALSLSSIEIRRDPKETEHVGVYDWSHREAWLGPPLTPQLRWLIPMAQERRGSHDRVWMYDIREEVP
jgi:8-oxo-dGTP diphosphatase